MAEQVQEKHGLSGEHADQINISPVLWEVDFVFAPVSVDAIRCSTVHSSHAVLVECLQLHKKT